MALTRIKSQSILDREVRERDLADGAVTISKINLLTSGSAGDVLTVDSFGNLLFAPVGGTPITLDSLVDVNTAGVSNNDILQYNSATLKWEAGAIVFGSIDNFNDVDTSTTPPTNGQVLAFNGSLWIPQTVGGVGSANATFVVADITARDALSPAVGDSAFVRDTTNGTGTAIPTEWGFFLWEGTVWVEIASQDSSRSDANTMEAIVFFNSSTPVLIGNVSDGSRITNVTVVIEPGNEFDGNIIGDPVGPPPDYTPIPPAFFSVGDVGNNARLIDDSAIDWTTAGSYVCNLDYIYDGTEQPDTNDTDIFAYFNFTGSTTGQARVIVTHV